MRVLCKTRTSCSGTPVLLVKEHPPAAGLILLSRLSDRPSTSLTFRRAPVQQLRVATKASLPDSLSGNQKLCIRTAQRVCVRGALKCLSTS